MQKTKCFGYPARRESRKQALFCKKMRLQQATAPFEYLI